jgi:hypothetical protein
MSWADPAQGPEYLLIPRQHKPGVPLDMISYHFHSERAPDATADVQ